MFNFNFQIASGSACGNVHRQGGNGIPCLANQVYSYIIHGGFSDFEVSLEDIPEEPVTILNILFFYHVKFFPILFF